MTIVFRPTGKLDINTDAGILPESSENGTVFSGAMKRCKNLKLDRPGKLSTRNGSSKINDSGSLVSSVSVMIEQGGTRYEFTDAGVYRNETLITAGVKCETPEFSPAAGSYGSDPQTVTISSGTLGAKIFYTLDGSTPTKSSLRYVNPIMVSLLTLVKAIAVKTGFNDSDVASAYYGATSIDLNTEGGDDLVSETDSDDLIGEGVPT